MNKKIILTIIMGIILVGAGIGGVYYYKYYKAKKSGSTATETAKETGKTEQSSESGQTSESKKLSDDETDLGNGITVKKIDSKYKTASGKTSGWFKTGQEADILLSGIDFNNTGGALLFNHLGGVASDGTHLILADRNNNRVLIWNSLPDGNKEPDLVLGQKNFTSNNPGEGLDGLNWPVGVATDGTHLLVSDTYNHRVLIWNSFPTSNGQAADIELKGAKGSRSDIAWPWQIWTNGEKVVITSTGAAKVLIYNSIPTQNNQKADVILALSDFGTPRSVGSDGKTLIIGDHNSKVNGAQGNFFWKTFPTSDDQNYDFFMAGIQQSAASPSSDGSQPSSSQGQPFDSAQGKPSGSSQGESSSGQVCDPPPAPCSPPSGEVKGVSTQSDIFWSPVFTAEGKLIILAGAQLDIWNSFPQDENDGPDLVVGGSGAITSSDQYAFYAGDGSGVTLAGGKLYLSLSNGNKIVGFNSLPTESSQKPDFAIGSSDIDTNTLETNFIISNPVTASNGKSLFVSSDFDRKLYVWKNLPDESGAHPDLVYTLPEGPWDNDLYNDTLVLAGKKSVYIWKQPPTEAQAPDLVLKEKIGNTTLGELGGVALDEKYFYLADGQNKKVYVWEGIPGKDSDPKFSLTMNNTPGRLSSDGNYLVVTHTTDGSSLSVYKVGSLSENSQPQTIGGPGIFNLPQGAFIKDGHLFVGDTGFNRVHIWNNIEDALARKSADVILGLTEKIERAEEAKPQIGKNKLFWPSNPYFDGSYLWVGEFKFSERILRFSPSM